LKNANQSTPPFEVRPSVHYDTTTRQWFAALSLYTNGVLQNRSMLTEAGGFENDRRCKQFARAMADEMEMGIKRRVLVDMLKAGEGLLKHGGR
jgi:hypothetical protein